MRDLLKEILYHEEEDGTLNYRDIPSYVQMSNVLEDYHNKIKNAFGMKFMDELVGAEADVYHLETLACFRHGFRHGFRLAGRLMVEALGGRT